MAKLRRGEWDAWISGVIIGTTEHEGSVFAMGMGVSDDAGFEVFVKRTCEPLLLAHHPLVVHF